MWCGPLLLMGAESSLGDAWCSFWMVAVFSVAGCQRCPSVLHAHDRHELLEPDFLDLVDQACLVLITGQGAVGLDAEARRLGLQFPALGTGHPRAFVSLHQLRGTATPCFALDVQSHLPLRCVIGSPSGQGRGEHRRRWSVVETFLQQFPCFWFRRRPITGLVSSRFRHGVGHHQGWWKIRWQGGANQI